MLAFAVGILLCAHQFFCENFDASMRAADLVGPNARAIFSAANRSTIPAASGSSGPTTVRSTRFSLRSERAPANHSWESRHSRQFRQCPRFPVRRKYAQHVEIAAVSMRGRVRGAAAANHKNLHQRSNRSGTVMRQPVLAAKTFKLARQAATLADRAGGLSRAIQRAGSATPISRCGE